MARASRGFRWSVAVFIVATVISAGIAYVSVVPRESEGSFLLYVLGEGGMLEHYFPADNSTIMPGVPIRWYLRVANGVGSVQYVAVKAKLGNASVQCPDDVNASPAPIPAITEFRRVLVNNQTWEIPFTWKVIEIQQDVEGIHLALDINGLEVEPIVSAAGDNDFRIIFELWTLSPGDDHMSFGWMSGDQRHVAWLQLRFNVAYT